MNGSKVLEFLTNNTGLFKDFPAERVRELVGGSTLSTFEPNEAIIEFGEEGRFLGILLEGEAAVSVTDDGGEKHDIGVLKAGDIFGEMSLMTGDKTMADVIALTRCTALLIPQSLFSTILATHPPAIRHVSKLIAERLKAAAEEKGRDLAASALRRSDDPYGFSLKTGSPMKLLVVNSGSSSLKYNLYDTADDSRNARGIIEKIGEPGTRHTFRSSRGEVVQELPRGGHKEAFAAMAAELTAEETGVLSSLEEVTAVGHRVVHGGEVFQHHAVIRDETIAEMEKLSPLAPLHNPVNVLGIREARACIPKATHVAVFDTSFHHTLPAYAYLYGLPWKFYEEKGIRRYGFHGMSHGYVALQAAAFLKRPFNELEIITCHLGNGASICAVDHGRSVDTTMGLTPTDGLLMGTRCGSIDPAILVHLARTEGMTADRMDRLINKESGLKGLSGVSNDMREIEKAAREGNPRALLACKTFCYQIRKYIGAYVAAMGGLDVLVFTGGIGQGSAGVRSLACQGLQYMGIQVDEAKNRNARGFDAVCDIAAEEKQIRILVVPTDEERMIARETLRAVGRGHVATILECQVPKPVPVEVSAHHIHLAPDHVAALYGPGMELTPESELSQPGQFACREKVTLVGPKGKVERVRVLGPARKETQVEISLTEQFVLGIHPPIRESGDLKGSPGITLEGPAGTVTLDKGVVCALRHIHMSPEDALHFGLHDKDVVRVRVEGDRELVFGDVLVRVHPSFRLAMHLDTDEANAGNIRTGTVGFVEGIQSRR
jgi:acetate kinase